MNQTEKDFHYLAELVPWLRSRKIYYPTRFDELVEERAVNVILRRSKKGLEKFA